MTKNSRFIDVTLGVNHVPVGRLVFETDGTRQASMFRYDERWLTNDVRFAISPHYPLIDAPFHASGSRDNRRGALPYPIADGAPDAWGRGIIAKSVGRQANELDFLLHADDFTRQGALRYLDEHGQCQSSAQPAIPRLNDLEDLRELARVYENDPDEAARIANKIISFAGSLGGARPKFSFDDEGVLAIAKFTSERDTMPIERAEVATLKLARIAGINVPNARLELKKTERPVAIITRFDRRGHARIPYLSGQSFIDVDATKGGYYTDLADTLRANALNPSQQLEELYSRVLFTILVSNNDDHLKNHGFLYAGTRKWVLSPAFDINPQPERHRHLETGISPMSGSDASIDAAIEAAPFFEISRDRAVQILTRIVEAIDGKWHDVLAESGMTEKQIRTYRPAFHHEETDFARALITRSLVRASPK